MSLAGKIVALSTAVAKGVLESVGLTSGGVSVVTDVRSMVVVQRVTSQTIANTTQTAISWTVEARDDLGISAVGAGANTKVCTFTAPGVWDCVTNGIWDGNASGGREWLAALFDSGDSAKWVAASGVAATPAGIGCYQTVAGTFSVVSGDYVKILVTQTSGGDLGVAGTTPPPSFVHCTLTRRGT